MFFDVFSEGLFIYLMKLVSYFWFSSLRILRRKQRDSEREVLEDVQFFDQSFSYMTSYIPL